MTYLTQFIKGFFTVALALSILAGGVLGAFAALDIDPSYDVFKEFVRHPIYWILVCVFSVVNGLRSLRIDKT